MANARLARKRKALALVLTHCGEALSKVLVIAHLPKTIPNGIADARTPFSVDHNFQSGMSTNPETRLRKEALKHACRVRNLDAAALARLIGFSYSYAAALLNVNSEKAFGEKIARRIEDGLGLLPKSLDEAPSASVLVAMEPTKPYARRRQPTWLFSQELFEALHTHDSASLLRLENMLRALVELPPLEAACAPAKEQRR